MTAGHAIHRGGILRCGKVRQPGRNGKLAKRTPIKGCVQLLKIFLYTIGAVLVITSIMDVSPFGILSA